MVQQAVEEMDIFSDGSDDLEEDLESARALQESDMRHPATMFVLVRDNHYLS